MNIHKKNDSPNWITIIAQVGFIAKGIIYFSVGLLAFRISLGIGGKVTGATEILKHFVHKPFGVVILIVSMLGLLAHAAWKEINGFLDVGGMGDDLKGIFFRSVEVIIGLLYLSMSYAALQIIIGKGAESSDQSTKIWIGRVLTLPYGKWLVFVVAAVVLIVGFYQFYIAYKASFEYRFDESRMDSKEKRLLKQIGRIGIGSWGIVYCMMAYLLYQAGIHADPDQAGGLGKALSALAAKPYGTWILGITACGLMIYGIYLFTLSYFHQTYK